MTDGFSGASLALPEPLELMSAAAGDEIVAEVAAQISALQRQVADAESNATAAEARAAAEGADERATTLMMVELQRFLNGRRDELDEELRALSDVTAHRAARRREEARAQADLMRRLGRTTPSEALSIDLRDIHVSLPPLPAHVADQAGDSSSPEWTYSPVLSEAPLPPPVMVPDEPAPQLTVVPITPAAVPAAPALFAPPAPPGEIDADLPTLDVQASAEPVAAVNDAPVVDADVAPVVSHSAEGAWEPAPTSGADFWTDQAPEPEDQQENARKGFLRRIPVIAVLQVLAVLLILVFILLRLG